MKVKMLVKRREGQVWSLDYTIGFLLFLFTLLLALSLLGKTVLHQDDFAALSDSATVASDKLLSSGYPVGWRADDVIIPGLLTDDRLSMRKAERFDVLSPEEARALLNLDAEWALTLVRKDGSLLPILDDCYLGSSAVTETKSVWTRNRSLSLWPAGRLAQNLTAANLSVTTPANLTAFLDNLSNVELAVLESPRLGQEAHPYDSEKGEVLREYVRLGGTLLLIGDVNLTEAFGLNLTRVNTTDDATAQNDTFLNLTGTIQNVTDTDWAVTDTGQDHYVSLARLSDGRDFAATFRYGDGDVYYLGGLNGTMNDTGEPLLARVARALAAAATAPTATCTSVELPSAKQRVVVRRLVAYDGEILTLTLSVWEE